ncbi:MAG: type II secretion system inner membrane protein GspF [Hydrogenovibrio sp.]|uniref:type II secretion system inner membrane protein GspF n=1 Tax=Hydrogenovibrio sp. TaxID=2065821 RepID=UPI0028708061|nr:type II secretion system inner membrane protein GspF [Hydrogenovibrio sp.]MDR9499550.1 type II secretion system inner membrane protein GspF [Hydrogenovibrio sp.]
MSQYHYQAVDTNGKSQKGQLQADSERQLRQRLRDKGLIPVEIKHLGEAEKSQSKTSKMFKAKLKVSEQALVISQLNTLLSAGVTLASALRSIVQQVDKRSTQRFVAQVHHGVMEGFTLAQSIEQSGFAIDPTMIATVKAGEESGHLSAVLGRLAESIVEQEKLQKKIRTALIYPAIMVVMSVVIVLFLMVYVVPKVVSVFDSSGQALPELTQLMLTLSDVTQRYWLEGVLTGVVIYFVYRFLMRERRWQHRRDRLLLRLPLIKKFLMLVNSARWSRTLGVLLESGVNITDALGIASEVVTLRPLQDKTSAMTTNVKEGQPLYQAMTEAGFFPGLLVSLVQTGEGSGQLAQMLDKGADHYEHEVTNAATVLVSLVEPIMILIMGGVVLTIVLSIMLPIFEMNQMIGE